MTTLSRSILVFQTVFTCIRQIYISGEETNVVGCPRALSVPIINASATENGSIFFRNVTYPSELVWTSEDNLTFGCPCELSTPCIRTCCETEFLLNGSTCLRSDTVTSLRLPDDNVDDKLRLMGSLEDAFNVVSNMICHQDAKYALDPDNYPSDEWMLHSNGTLTTVLQTFQPVDYCFGWNIQNQTPIVIVCFADEVPPQPVTMTIYGIGQIISIIFLMATIIIYAILPELLNLHGKTLMCYVASLVNAYIFLVVIYFDQRLQQTTCVIFAYTIYFSFLASFFWLNVMCFDIWWTFGGYRSLQGSVKQRERKKFFLYSIYAWGAAILLTALCITVDNVAAMSKNIIVPGFGVSSCWFADSKAKGLYFYVPMGITISCNIILFISTALKIAQHKRDTAHQLKGMDSRRHDDNKQWFNLYLKLFIVMGINWSMEIISWLYDTPAYLWYITDMGNTLQGVIIFIIFVWKEKIKRLLFKRFGCQGPKFLSRDSTRSAYPSSTSRTCTTSVPLHEKTHDKMSSLPDPLPHGKTHFEDSDGV